MPLLKRCIKVKWFRPVLLYKRDFLFFLSDFLSESMFPSFYFEKITFIVNKPILSRFQFYLMYQSYGSYSFSKIALNSLKKVFSKTLIKNHSPLKTLLLKTHLFIVLSVPHFFTDLWCHTNILRSPLLFQFLKNKTHLHFAVNISLFFFLFSKFITFFQRDTNTSCWDWPASRRQPENLS